MKASACVYFFFGISIFVICRTLHWAGQTWEGWAVFQTHTWRSGSIQGRDGQDSEKPDITEDVPLGHFPTQTILWFYGLIFFSLKFWEFCLNWVFLHAFTIIFLRKRVEQDSQSGQEYLITFSWSFLFKRIMIWNWFCKVMYNCNTPRQTKKKKLVLEVALVLS